MARCHIYEYIYICISICIYVFMKTALISLVMRVINLFTFFITEGQKWVEENNSHKKFPSEITIPAKDTQFNEIGLFHKSLCKTRWAFNFENIIKNCTWFSIVFKSSTAFHQVLLVMLPFAGASNFCPRCIDNWKFTGSCNNIFEAGSQEPTFQQSFFNRCKFPQGSCSGRADISNCNEIKHIVMYQTQTGSSLSL